MGRSMFTVSTVTILVAIISSIGYTAGQCPSTVSGQLRYMFYPSVTQDFTLCSTNVSYTCPNGFVYNPRSSINDRSPLCTFRRAGSFTFDCSQNGNGSYSGDATLYSTCVNGNAIAVSECPKGMTFMRNTRRCEMRCSNVGIFGVSEQEYYTCTYDYRTYQFTMRNETCPQNTELLDVFDFCLGDENPIPTPPSSTSSEMTTELTTDSSFILPSDPPTDPTTDLTDLPSFSPDPSSPATDSSTITSTDLPTDDPNGLSTIPAVSTFTTTPENITSKPTTDPTDSSAFSPDPSSTSTDSSTAVPTDSPTDNPSSPSTIPTITLTTTTTTEPPFPWGQL